jgi:hypothetical protein
MQPEQPNTPSQDTEAAPDAAAQEPRSDESKEGSSPRWWQRMFNRTPTEIASGDGDEDTQDGTSRPLTLSQEELDRRVQAETDRREAKRAQEARVAQRRRLRDEDPWAYAEQERQAEQHEVSSGAMQGFLATVGTEHDKVAIDPLVEALPKEERERILKLEGAGQGLAGRKLLVGEALKSLQRQWKAEGEREAERKLRGNNAFRKQVLRDSRSDVAEPELLPALSSSAADAKVSDILRGFYGMGPRR